MNEKKSYEGPLAELLERYASTGDRERLEDYLASNSNLPGPRGNLELAYAFGDQAAELSRERPEAAWELVDEMTKLSPAQAPVNDPREILPFCGALAAGSVGAARSELFAKALSRLRELSRDPRWRTREGVAMGLQRLLAKDALAVMRELEGWVTGEDWLAMRAVAAGVAEPPLLANELTARGALELHRMIISRVLASQARRTDEFRTLRQGLGYSLSVVVSAIPSEGFEYLHQLARSEDKDIQWVLRENLKKKRLADRFPDEVRSLSEKH